MVHINDPNDSIVALPNRFVDVNNGVVIPHVMWLSFDWLSRTVVSHINRLTEVDNCSGATVRHIPPQ
jgi:hypothetical protein